jgi:hypothetical protein
VGRFSHWIICQFRIMEEMRQWHDCQIGRQKFRVCDESGDTRILLIKAVEFGGTSWLTQDYEFT